MVKSVLISLKKGPSRNKRQVTQRLQICAIGMEPEQGSNLRL